MKLFLAKISTFLGGNSLNKYSWGLLSESAILIGVRILQQALLGFAFASKAMKFPILRDLTVGALVFTHLAYVFSINVTSGLDNSSSSIGAYLRFAAGGKELDIEDSWELNKRNEIDRSTSKLIQEILDRMSALKLRWLDKENYFSKLLKKVKRRELHLHLGVSYLVKRLSCGHVANFGYAAKKRYFNTPGYRRNAGEAFAGIEEFDDRFTLIIAINGNGDYLPGFRDSCALSRQMYRESVDLYREVRDKNSFAPTTLAEHAWDEIVDDGANPGCISMMHVMISPLNQIQISNLGMFWAGLHRNGQLIQQTRLQMNSNGKEFQVCNTVNGFQPEYENKQLESEIYTWQAQENDVLVFVNKGILTVLNELQIWEGIHTIKNLGPAASIFSGEDEFNLAAMGIVKCAALVHYDDIESDMLAGVVKIRLNI